MGEFGAVLNGVAFWTRHNDYKLAAVTFLPSVLVYSLPSLDKREVRAITTN